MLIRSLDPQADRAAVRGFYDEIADYVWMERAAPPDDQIVDEFFTDAPPGCDPAASLRLGMFDDQHLIAIAEMARGYPSATDAYIGFLAVSAAARSKGAGTGLLRHLEQQARASGADHIYMAVLDANRRGRAFWEREGFALALANREVTLGEKTQLAHRLGKTL